MRIAGFMATHHLAAEAETWIRHAREIFDEFVIFLDENRLTPGTAERALRVASRVERRRAESWYELDFGSMASACDSDWVFALDHDEELSAEWSRDALRTLVETTHFTHFWCARRWVIPGQQYLHTAPWWPDLQLRLLRNRLSGTAFPTRLHDLIQVSGPGACLSNLSIHHHVLWLLSRPEREAKVRAYEQLRPGGDLRYYYLYEEHAPPTQAIAAAHPAGAAHKVLVTDKLPEEAAAKISLQTSDVPQTVRAGEMFFVSASVMNGGAVPISSSPPFGVRLSYHWRGQATGETIVFEGIRTDIFPELVSGAFRTCSMAVIAPQSPGKYVLQTTLVQEHVRWFDDLRRDIVQEFAIRVE